MDTQAPRRRIRLLDDAPADTDAFGPHQRIAHTIRVLMDREDRGKAIALVGSWGSGKSTVVRLLERECANQENSLLFVFDAWAHEGDPLRRTFLEKLIKELQKVKWISVSQWEERLEELTKRRRQSTVKSRPRLTGLGTVSAILLFLVPIGIELLKNQSVWWKTAGVVFALAPVLAVATNWLFKHGWQKEKHDRWNVFGHLVSKTEEVTRTETLESPDPTSVEFEAWFCDLADEALQDRRRLLIVLDNLDRVDSEDARKLWTAMRTFLDFPQGNAPEWVSRLWTLVPFDLEGITKLWGDGEGKAEIRDRFIAKTFQVQFKVPPPLLSDWRSFFLEQLKIAFPEQPEDEFYTISRIYGILCPASPTPRAIKLCINEMGVVYENASYSVPLKNVGLFVAVNLAVPRWTPTSPLPSEELLQPYLDANWREELAALFFTLPKAKARQVLYGDLIEKTLTDGSGEALQTYIDIPGIDFVIDQILDQRLATWQKKEPHLLGRAACALSQVTASSAAKWDKSWARISETVRAVKEWPFLDATAGRGLAALLGKANEEQFTRGVLDSLNEVPSPDPRNSELLGRWAEGLLELLQGMADGQQGSFLNQLTSLDFGRSAAQYVSLVSEVFRFPSRHDVWRFVRTRRQREEVIRVLETDVSAGQFGVHSEQACEVMSVVDDAWPWGPLINALQNRFNQMQLGPQEAGPVLRTLLILKNSNVSEADGALQNIVSGGWVFHCISLAINGNHFDSAAACILVVLIYQPEGNAGVNVAQAISGRNLYRQFVSNPQPQPNIVQEVVKLATSLGYGRLLLERRNEANVARPLIDYILQAMVTGSQAVQLFPASVVIETWPLTRDTFGGHFDGLVTQLSATGELVEHLSRAAFSVKLASLYQIALRKETPEPFLSATAEKLRALSRDEWLQGLRIGSDLIGLVREIQKSGATIGAGHSLQDALAEIVKDMAAGKEAGRLDGGSFNALLDSLSGEQRELMIRHVRDEVIEAERDATVLLTVFSAALDHCEFLSEKADDLVRRAFKGMLQRRIHTEISWVSDVLRKCPDFLKQTKPATKSDFKERIRELLEEPLSEDVAKSVQEIAVLLKVKRG